MRPGAFAAPAPRSPRGAGGLFQQAVGPLQHGKPAQGRNGKSARTSFSPFFLTTARPHISWPRPGNEEMNNLAGPASHPLTELHPTTATIIENGQDATKKRFVMVGG